MQRNWLQFVSLLLNPAFDHCRGGSRERDAFAICRFPEHRRGPLTDHRGSRIRWVVHAACRTGQSARHTISGSILPGRACTRRCAGDSVAGRADSRRRREHERPARLPGAQCYPGCGHTHVRRILPLRGRARHHQAQPLHRVALRWYRVPRPRRSTRAALGGMASSPTREAGKEAPSAGPPAKRAPRRRPKAPRSARSAAPKISSGGTIGRV